MRKTMMSAKSVKKPPSDVKTGEMTPRIAALGAAHV